MAICYKTYKERAPKDTKFCLFIQDFGELLIDISDKIGVWRKRKKWRIIFIPIEFICDSIIIIFLLSTVLLLYPFLFYKKTFFIEGKEYDVEKKINDVCVFNISEKSPVTIIFRTKKWIFNPKYWWTNFSEGETMALYENYFVDNIKEYRKIKLTKLNKIVD